MRLQEIKQDELIRLIVSSSDNKIGKSLNFVIDIGATNARFGFVSKMTTNSVVYFYKKPVTSIEVLKGEFRELAEALGPACQRIEAAAMNIPGPTDGLVGGPIANYTGTNEEKMCRIAEFPKALFPTGASILLNDLEAGAYGVVAASKLSFFSDLFNQMWNPKDGVVPQGSKLETLEPGHILVLAPGTGLGNAMIQYHPFSKNFTVLPLEFGHTSVQSRKHRPFLSGYEKDMDRGDHEVEYDDLCSGRGLERMYRFITTKNGSKNNKKNLSAGEIAGKAAKGDVAAQKAMAMFYQFLMKFASQLSMGFVPRYVVVIGDNTAKNKFFFTDANTKRMRKQFLGHSMERYGFMSRVTMLRQVQEANLNLIGCAYVTQLEQQANKSNL